MSELEEQYTSILQTTNPFPLAIRLSETIEDYLQKPSAKEVQISNAALK